MGAGDVVEWVMLFAGTIVVLTAVGVGWRVFMGGVRRGLASGSPRRTRAQVVDVGLFDTHDNDNHVTHYRVVLRLSVESGDLVCVDTTLRPTAAQKDMLLIDHWLTIEHAREDPQDFRIVWEEGVRRPDGERKVEAEARREQSTGIYGPPP